jgi:Ca2+-transporting ATPase
MGYDLDTTRATAFHFMAVGQLFLTYPSRHTWTHPLPNRYLHAAVLGGIAIQLAAAWLPLTSRLLGDASIPAVLWLVVFGAAGLSWALAESISRAVWRRSRRV